MTLFFSLLPVYLFGNIHCLGMCGPLVMLIGKHKFRALYFVGRLASFSLAGFIAAEMGVLLQVLLKELHLPAVTSFLFGLFILWMGMHSLMGQELQIFKKMGKVLAPFNQKLTHFLLTEAPWGTFLFGFFTIALPCGQTLLVFSACALSKDPVVGLFNGFAFALLTSPSLLLALHAHKLLGFAKNYTHFILGISSLFIGILALLRSFAEWGMISHLTLSEKFHFIIY